MQLPSQLRDQAGQLKPEVQPRSVQLNTPQSNPDALLVEMRTHDDLGQSSRNVLYGEADGDVEATLGSGTSLAPQQHDETGVSESSHFLGKRRRLDIIAESARRLLGRFGLGKSAGAKPHLERMMSGLLGEKHQSSSIRFRRVEDHANLGKDGESARR